MDLLFLVTFFVATLSSTLSGVAGGGGGFVMSPYWLLAGLTPAQGATTGAFMALGMGTSSLAAFRGSGHMPQSKKLPLILTFLTVLTSLIGPFFLQHIQTETFKPLLALVTLMSLPFLFLKPKIATPNRRQSSVGYALLALLLLASSFMTSSVFWIVIAIILSQTFGLTVLQGTVIRRFIAIIQSIVIFVILASFGNFLWQHALAAILGGSIGSYIGTKFAIKRGERFAKYTLATSAAVSALLLLLA